MIINNNIQALVINNSLWKKGRELAKNSKNISVGTKINSAGDDPAGMAIANKMKSQIAGIDIANRNTNDAMSLLQTAEGALNEVSSMSQRLRELAVQGANDTLTEKDRALLQEEANQLIKEITATSERVEFNERTLFNGRYDSFIFQIGEKEGMELDIAIPKIDGEELGFSKTVQQPPVPPATQPTTKIEYMSYKDSKDCQDAIEICDKAIAKLNETRATLGAMQNKLERNSNSLEATNENYKISLSRVLDTDVAYEMSEYTKNNVLSQSGLAMLAQANQRPNQILSLLK